MTVDYFNSVEAIKKHFVKAVYRTVPSHSNKEIAGWKKCDDESEMIEALGLNARAFDVLEDKDTPPVLVWTCSGVDNWNVTINIEVGYPNSKKYTTIANSDHTKIRGEIMGATDIELHAFNFGYSIPEEPIFEDDDDEEYMVMTIPILCNIDVGLESTIEQWQDGDLGVAVQDT